MKEVKLEMGIVYKVYNKISNKVYIGQTINTLEERKYHHYYSLRYNYNNHFKNALKKYNEDDWEWEIIDEADDIEILNLKEEKWIKYYNTTDRECGYNSIEGGNNRKFNNELKQKLSDSQNKRFEDENERNKIRESLQLYREEHPEILIKHSEKIKEFYIENPQVKIEHSKFMKEYYSNIENRENISKIKKEFYKNNPEKSKEHSKKMKQLYINNPDLTKRKYKKIRCIETGVIYDSIKQAGTKLGILPSNITAVLHERRKHTHNLRFEFVD